MSKQSDDKKENAALKNAVPEDSTSPKEKHDKGKAGTSKEPPAVAKDSGTESGDHLKSEGSKKQNNRKDAEKEIPKTQIEKVKTETVASAQKTGESTKVQTKAKESKESAKESVPTVAAKNAEPPAPVESKDVPRNDAEKKSDVPRDIAVKKAEESVNLDDGHVKSAIKSEILKKREDAKKEISDSQKHSTSRKEAESEKNDEVPVIDDLNSGKKVVEEDSEESEVVSIIAQNIFPENSPVRNVAALLEPTVAPSANRLETYAEIARAAEDSNYDSHQDVISSVQSILKPKGEFLSRTELLEASKQLRKVMPYNYEAWRLHADILLNALRQLETRVIMPDETFQILAIPLRENDIRDAAESALRQCAHFAANEQQRIRLVDEANSVRRLTWF